MIKKTKSRNHQLQNYKKLMPNPQPVVHKYSEYTNEKIAEGKAEGELVGHIKALVNHTKMTDKQIQEKLKPEYKDITKPQLEAIRASLTAA